MKIKITAAIVGVLFAIGAIGATTIWASGTNVLGAVQAVAQQSQFDDQQAANRCQAYEQALAHQLGVDVSKLQQAQKDAAKAVIDQALKDGKITADQAIQAKQKVDAAKFERCPNFEGRQGKPGGVAHVGLKTGIDAVAHALNMTSEQLTAALKSGQSVADLAKSKGVDLQTVKTAVVNAEKAQIDQALHDGKLTQAQADKMKSAIDQRGDKILDFLLKHHNSKTK